MNASSAIFASRLSAWALARLGMMPSTVRANVIRTSLKVLVCIGNCLSLLWQSCGIFVGRRDRAQLYFGTMVIRVEDTVSIKWVRCQARMAAFILRAPGIFDGVTGDICAG